MNQERSSYPSDLTAKQWEIIKELVEAPRSGSGRPKKTNLREVMNAIFYLARTGTPWRYLPKSFPPWRTVYEYFAKWSREGIWEILNRALTRITRQRRGKNEYPTVGIVDAQSMRCPCGEDRGYDAAKKVRGRKRNILVDTMGLLWSLKVHSARETDATGGEKALRRLPEKARENLKLLLGDHVYRWPFEDVAVMEYKIPVQIMGRTQPGVFPKPRRWIVERTFAWLNHYRRLSRDYERKTSHSEAFIYIAMSQVMLRRLN